MELITNPHRHRSSFVLLALCVVTAITMSTSAVGHAKAGLQLRANADGAREPAGAGPSEPPATEGSAPEPGQEPSPPADEAAGPGAAGADGAVEPTVRTKFADTAFWIAALTTDATGTAEVEFEMPENLTGWKIRTWGLGHGTKVGEGLLKRRPFEVDTAPALRAGRNIIALRIDHSRITELFLGGIVRPVYLIEKGG